MLSKMRLIRSDNFPHTHVVAEARNCLTFDQVNGFAAASLLMRSLFGILPPWLFQRKKVMPPSVPSPQPTRA
jgi:hypothetical protein